MENKYKVKLVSASQSGSSLSFDTSPIVSENRNVNYNSLEPLHAPGQIQVYKNTSSRNFQISDIKLISRTIKEADRNLRKLWLLKSWCLPRFGNSSSLASEQRTARQTRETLRRNPDPEGNNNGPVDIGYELLGSPPPILYLSAYSKNIGSAVNQTGGGKTVNVWNISQHINKIPVVIQQLSTPYPNDIDYITTSKGVPMPIIMNLDLALLESHSPNSYERFNLDAFRQGILQGF